MMLLGDKTRFAVSFELIADPDSQSPADVTASWGQIGIWVAERNLTLAYRDDTVLQAAEVPLLPVVRWLIESWDPLFHEEKLPRPTSVISAAAWRLDSLAEAPASFDELEAMLEDRDAWWRRHGLGSALEAYRIPDLHLRARGNALELSWDDREWQSVPTGAQLAQRPGYVILPREEVARTLWAWAKAVIEAISARDSLPDEIQRECDELAKGIDALQAPDRRLRRLEWTAGLSNLHTMAKKLREMAGFPQTPIEETLRKTLGLDAETSSPLIAPPTIPALLFRAVSPSLSEDDVHTIARLATHDPGRSSDALKSLRERAPIPSTLESITADGVERAIEARRALKIADNLPLTRETRDLEGNILCDLEISVSDVTLDDEHIDGIAIAADDRRPQIVINNSGLFARWPWGRRMTLAHELCHLLHDVDDRGIVATVSTPWADPARERRANAFAVTFLAPEPAIARLLCRDDVRTWTPEDLRRTMRTLGIGLTTLTWQLANLRWISESERLAWLDRVAIG